MPSVSLQTWQSVRMHALDELEFAHRSVGGSSRGRRHATQQINHAYAVLLSSQFQGFCRDLHSECTDYFAKSVLEGILRAAFSNLFVQNRKLDKGNPNPGNIGADNNRFGFVFWDKVVSLNIRNRLRQSQLETLNKWRNAIAHQDFDLDIIDATVLRIKRVREWRVDCNQLAISFDEVMRSYIQKINGSSPG